MTDINGTRTADAPFVECAICHDEEQVLDPWDVSIGQTRECSHCGAKLILEYEEVIRSWTWSATKG